MVSITISKKRLARLLRKPASGDKLTEALANAKTSVEAETPTHYQLEVTGDRPDLLSTAGVARAVNGQMGAETGLPKLPLSSARVRVDVHASVLPVRPVIVAALARGVKLDADALAELIQVQEKLTFTHGRRRRKVAIGLHDARALTPPYSYAAVAPASVSFVPLGETKAMTLRDVLEKHEKGKAYAHLVRDFKTCPLLTDAKKNVLSFPPVINGRLTELTRKTTDVFIDVTGTDLDACHTALSILCQDFADEGATIVPAEIHFPDRTLATPSGRARELVIGTAEANKLLGTAYSGKQLAGFLARQRLDARAEGEFLHAHVPGYRADFLHPVDAIEEIALGIGYDNLEPKLPTTFTKGGSSETAKRTDRARAALAELGFLEVATYVLTSADKPERARVPHAGPVISNPVSSEFDRPRSHLLPNLLDVLAKNTHHAYPQKLFEIGEVVVRDAASETGTRTLLRACAVTAHANANASEIASALHAFLARLGHAEQLEPAKTACFLAGRSASIHVSKKNRGSLGELHPDVLHAFGLEVPAAAFEVELA